MNARLQHHSASPPGRRALAQAWARRRAFTLIEVMIAMGIFFMAIFAILDLVSNCLRNARLLQQEHLDTGLVTSAIYQTNRFVEGSDSGDFEGTGYTWDTESHPDDMEGSNGLWRIQATISEPNGTSETTYMLRWGDPPPLNGVPTTPRPGGPQ